MSYGDEPEYITWQLFEGEENLGGMKTRMNGIPQIQAPCPLMTQVWEIKWEKKKWRYNVLHVDIIQHFNSELEQRRFEPDVRQPKVRFLHLWAVFCRAVWCPNFRAKVLLRLLEKEVLVSWHLRKIKVSLSIDVRRMPLLEVPIKRRKKRQCGAKIKKEKKNVR